MEWGGGARLRPPLPAFLPWLRLSLVTLTFAGVMAGLVALARTPAVKPFLPREYFSVLLVGHVDLAFVAWVLLMGAVLWQVAVPIGMEEGKGGAELASGMNGGRGGLYFSAAGVVLMILSLLVGRGTPVLSHYIPYLAHPVFALGLGLLFLGLSGPAFRALGAGSGNGDPVRWGARVSALSYLLSLFILLVSLLRLPGIEGTLEERVNAVFWGVGHGLQFAYTSAMVTAWLILLRARGREMVRPDMGRFLFALYPLGVAVLALGYLARDPLSLLRSSFPSDVMSWGLGVPTAGFLLLTVRPLVGELGRGERLDFRITSLLMSVIVYTLGGAMAVFGDLSQQTTRIPAHYHAVLGGVTIAFMGLTYELLRREGFRPGEFWARVQPYLYGAGVVLFALGMFWGGVHGAPRKTPGAEWARDPVALLALNLMGVGALLAVAGGLAYLLVAARAAFSPPRRPVAESSDIPGRGGS